MERNRPPEIRNATEGERERAISTITAAFLTDPMTRFACPQPHEYLLWMGVITEALAGPSFEHGCAYVAPDFSGAALWLPPGIHGDESRLEEVVSNAVPPDHVEDLIATTEAMAAHHPDEDHWFLPLIGVELFAQGSGLGSALMKHALHRVDEEHGLAYLESTNPRNLSLYLRFGFEVVGEIKIGKAPLITPMVRQPKV